jgi:chitin synthase
LLAHRPGGTSIYSLWKEFDKHSGVGGACGGEFGLTQPRSLADPLDEDRDHRRPRTRLQQPHKPFGRGAELRVQDVQHPRCVLHQSLSSSLELTSNLLLRYTPTATDKPLESVFGFISVLPGAFSAYRYKALLGAPLETYFLGEKMHEPGNVASLASSNMYLAEDRILCFEIVCKRKEAWTLKYVKSAKASTDVP